MGPSDLSTSLGFALGDVSISGRNFVVCRNGRGSGCEPLQAVVPQQGRAGVHSSPVFYCVYSCCPLGAKTDP